MRTEDHRPPSGLLEARNVSVIGFYVLVNIDSSVRLALQLPEISVAHGVSNSFL